VAPGIEGVAVDQAEVDDRKSDLRILDGTKGMQDVVERQLARIPTFTGRGVGALRAILEALFAHDFVLPS
jgi:hypothetical protein